MAVRNIFCLPALDWRLAPSRRRRAVELQRLLQIQHPGARAARPYPGKPRTINMSQLGEALSKAEPPVRALVVYNSNPAAVAPNQQHVLTGLRREDLFTVVLEHFQTDTADYADIVLPATTQLEHFDVHRSYGHTYVMLNTPAIQPLGESKPNTEIFRLLAKRMGFDEACFNDSDEDMGRQAIAAMKGISLEELKQKGWIPWVSPTRLSRTADFRHLPASASSIPSD